MERSEFVGLFGAILGAMIPCAGNTGEEKQEKSPTIEELKRKWDSREIGKPIYPSDVISMIVEVNTASGAYIK